LITTIIRNIKAVLLKAILLEYLKRRECLEIKKKIRSIEKLDRKIKKVGIERIDKNILSHT